MKAVIAKQPGGPEVLQLVDIDQPQTQQDEVKIHVKALLKESPLNSIANQVSSGKIPSTIGKTFSVENIQFFKVRIQVQVRTENGLSSRQSIKAPPIFRVSPEHVR